MCVKTKKDDDDDEEALLLYREEALPFVLNAFGQVSFSSPLVVSSRIFPIYKQRCRFVATGRARRERGRRGGFFCAQQNVAICRETFEGVIV